MDSKRSTSSSLRRPSRPSSSSWRRRDAQPLYEPRPFDNSPDDFPPHVIQPLYLSSFSIHEVGVMAIFNFDEPVIEIKNFAAFKLTEGDILRWKKSPKIHRYFPITKKIIILGLVY